MAKPTYHCRALANANAGRVRRRVLQGFWASAISIRVSRLDVTIATDHSDFGSVR